MLIDLPAAGCAAVIQESNEALSAAKLSEQQSVDMCQRLAADCRRLRDEVSAQQRDNQKLRDRMLRLSLRGKTEEQVGTISSYPDRLFLLSKLVFVVFFVL